MKRLAALTAAALLAILLLTEAVPARAASVGQISDFGWWTKRPGAQAVNNGFEVASGPDGEESVAAFRVTLTGSVTQATLSFVETTDPNVAKVSGTPAINVCTTTSVWTAESDAAFANAPKEDCTAAISMTVSTTGRWTADITSLLAGRSGSVSLMAVPNLAGTSPLKTGFNRQFGPPAVDTEGTPNAPASGHSSSTFTPPASQQFPAAQVFPTPPAAPVPINPNGTISAPASAPTPTTQGNITTASGVTIGLAHSAGDHKHWGRLVLYVPLAALIAIGYTLAQKTIVARDLIPSDS